MQRQIGTKPGGVIPAFKMTGGFLAMQTAKSCRVAAYLPVDSGQLAFNQVAIKHQLIFCE